MAGPLDGIRIIDLTAMLAGPWATMILGDQGRRRDQGRSPRARRPHPLARPPRTQPAGQFSQYQPLETLGYHRSQDRGRTRIAARSGARRGCPGAEFPPRRGRAPRRRRSRYSRGRAGHRLCLDLRIRRKRTLCRETDLRSDHPGAVGTDHGAGRLGRRASAPGAHRAARQIDRDDRGAGDRGGAVCPRAHRNRAACAPVDAGFRCCRSCGPRTWARRPSSTAR